MNIAAPIEDANAIPLDTLDISDPSRFQADTIWPLFARLRREAPVHFCANGMFGPYWSITRYNDIMTVDTSHQVFSSEPTITLFEPPKELLMPMFIAMDQPKHDEQRKAVQGIVQPPSLAKLEPLIRQRVIGILESLPVNEEFDWVQRVSIELTTQMLATLFDFPFEDRRLLTYWSDTATMLVRTPEDLAFREGEMQKCLAYFVKLWNERVNAPPANNLISMLAHNPATQNMGPREYLGNILLLIVGGNDTTRNTISSSILNLNKNPGEYEKLRKDPSLIPNMVSETIRFQTPLSYMRGRPRAISNSAARPSRLATRSRCGSSPEIATMRFSRIQIVTGSTAPMRAGICRSASAFTAAWAIAWANCSSRSCGKSF